MVVKRPFVSRKLWLSVSSTLPAEIIHKNVCNFFSSQGGVHKLCWQVLGFFDHLPPFVDIFYLMNVDKKWTFLDYLPTSSCRRSLWTAPNLISNNLAFRDTACDLCRWRSMPSMGWSGRISTARSQKRKGNVIYGYYGNTVVCIVHISSDEVFSKILKKPSTVLKKKNGSSYESLWPF